MTKLSVNINKIALIRNSRKGNNPSLEFFSRKIIEAGAHGITVHPRPDQRHIRADDLSDLFDLAKLSLYFFRHFWAPVGRKRLQAYTFFFEFSFLFFFRCDFQNS